LGHKRTLRRLRTMSALPPKADIGTQSRNVRLVPKADIEMPRYHFADSSPLLTPSLNYQLVDERRFGIGKMVG
jgi:hypothetical protein